MSVTTVLVPVLPPEAEALLSGAPAPALLARAQRLRARVGQIDTVREELHALLFPCWESELARAPNYHASFLERLLRPPEPPRVPAGYDPYVHVFGRSLPVVGDSSKAVAERLAKLLAADDESFATGIASDLRAIDARAAGLLAGQPAAVDVIASITREEERLTEAMRAHPPRAREAYDSVVRLSAWSWPVWRLDGVMLGELTRLLGITAAAGRATSLFEDLEEPPVDLAPTLASLPKGLENFSGGGSFWSSTDVKLVAGSLRLYRTKLAKNAVTNGDDPTTSLRHLRLLEEAVLFCEAEGLALAEAAGVEWHDRPSPVLRSPMSPPS